MEQVHPELMLSQYLAERARERFAWRRERNRQLSGPAEWERLQTSLKAHFLTALGSFGERTPLHPQVTRQTEREGYRVENLRFESQPGFFVTANVFVPAQGSTPYPAVLVPCGHTDNGKAYPEYQGFGAVLARNGYVALCFDPVGQGERIEHVEAPGRKSSLGGSTLEHTLVGNQCLLTGTSLALYMVWDGIRAIDYLSGRPEVDPERIGVAGCSGGGTQTAYIAIADQRVQAAVPICYITSREALTEGLGPQDAEQNLAGAITAGLDFAEMVALCSPRAYLIAAARDDFFPLAGAAATYAEAHQLYALSGHGDRIGLAVNPGGHGLSEDMRRSALAWFGHWLGSGREIDVRRPEPLPDEELWSAPAGQVGALGGVTVGDLNRRRAEEIRPRRPAAQHSAPFLAGVREQVVRLNGVHLPASAPSRSTVKGERIELQTEPGVWVPGVLARPPQGVACRGAVLCLPDRHKEELRPLLAALAHQGIAALAVDPRGMGETASTRFRDGEGLLAQLHGNDAKHAYEAFLLGETLIGQRVSDALAALAFLKAEVAYRAGICGWGYGGLLALHAAALAAEITALSVHGALDSYHSLVREPQYDHPTSAFIPGVLGAYDLPDLVALAAPRPVWIDGSVDNRHRPLSAASLGATYSWPQSVFALAGGGTALSLSAGPTATAAAAAAWWARSLS